MKPELQKRIAQIRRGVAPLGYRKTKAGVLPNEWQSVRLDSVLRKETQKNTRNEVRNILTNSAVYGIISQTDFFDKQIANDENTDGYYIVKPGFFVYNPRISVTAPCGPFNKYYGNCDGIMSPLYTVYKPISDSPYYSEYLAHYFLSTYWHRYMKGIANYGVRSDRMNVTSDDMKRMPLPYPPLEEQRRIAEILTAQDKIIALKERRLAEKRQQKTGLAQRLLTGKTRLPGFDGKWKTERLGALFAERVETKRQDLELLAITASQGVVPRSRLDLKDNSSEDKSKYLRICVGDIGYNTMRMWQGVSAYSNYEGIVSPAYTVLKSNANVCAKYFAYLFKMPKIVFLFYRYSQGLVDDTRNLKYANFKKISVVYPPNLEEQQAIAEVLTCADREIEALQRDLELEKRKKKALMQLLLTGVVRVNSRRRTA